MISILNQPQNLVPKSSGYILGSHTIRWTEKSKLAFLRRANKEPRFYWESGQESIGFAGFGIAVSVSSPSGDRFAMIQNEIDLLMEREEHFGEVSPEVEPRFFGGFSFADYSRFGQSSCWGDFPAGQFVLPKYLLTHYDDQAWLTVYEIFDDKTPRIQRQETLLDQLWNLPDLIELPGTIEPKVKENIHVKDLMSFNEWEQMVNGVTERVSQGDVDKVVLSRSREIDAAGMVSMLTMLSQLKVKYPDCYRFLFEPKPGYSFLGATPELLVKKNNNKLKTVALAGSLKRGETYLEDQSLGQKLLSNQKDLHEHNLVIKAIKIVLDKYSCEVYIDPFPQLMQLNNVQHLVTHIEAELSREQSILQLVEALHPTPAVGGLPRKQALEYIEQFEAHDRGWYAGPLGWLDAKGNGIFSVALRSAVRIDRVFTLFAGAGIVGKSEPEKEWKETEWKFRPIEDAIMHGVV